MSILYPEGVLSADGEHLTCRHCGEFKRVFKSGDEGLPSMGRRVCVMRNRERKCKHKACAAHNKLLFYFFRPKRPLAGLGPIIIIIIIIIIILV